MLSTLYVGNPSNDVELLHCGTRRGENDKVGGKALVRLGFGQSDKGDDKVAIKGEEYATKGIEAK